MEFASQITLHGFWHPACTPLNSMTMALIFFFNWSTVNLQCYVSFWYTENWNLSLILQHPLRSSPFPWNVAVHPIKTEYISRSLDLYSEKAMAPHSSTFAWKIPWMEEPGRLQSMGSLRVRHDWATLLSLFTFMHWRRRWQPTPVFLPGESQGPGSLVAAIYGVAQSRTRLKWLSIA